MAIIFPLNECEVTRSYFANSIITFFSIQLQQTVHQQIRTDFRPSPQWVNSNENQPSQSSYVSSMVKKPHLLTEQPYTLPNCSSLSQPNVQRVKSTKCLLSHS